MNPGASRRWSRPGRAGARLDLAEFFVISKPGNYRVELRSEGLQDEDGKPGIVAGTIQVVP